MTAPHAGLWTAPHGDEVRGLARAEVLYDGCMSKAGCVYSFGVVLWELLAGSRAWSGMKPCSGACVCSAYPCNTPLGVFLGTLPVCPARTRPIYVAMFGNQAYTPETLSLSGGCWRACAPWSGVNYA